MFRVRRCYCVHFTWLFIIIYNFYLLIGDDAPAAERCCCFSSLQFSFRNSKIKNQIAVLHWPSTLSLFLFWLDLRGKNYFTHRLGNVKSSNSVSRIQYITYIYVIYPRNFDTNYIILHDIRRYSVSRVTQIK